MLILEDDGWFKVMQEHINNLHLAEMLCRQDRCAKKEEKMYHETPDLRPACNYFAQKLAQNPAEATEILNEILGDNGSPFRFRLDNPEETQLICACSEYPLFEEDPNEARKPFLI